MTRLSEARARGERRREQRAPAPVAIGESSLSQPLRLEFRPDRDEYDTIRGVEVVVVDDAVAGPQTLAWWTPGTGIRLDQTESSKLLDQLSHLCCSAFVQLEAQAADPDEPEESKE